MDHNALLTQLGYNVDKSTSEQIKRILNNTDGLTAENVIALNDRLKPHLCFVAMSGSEDRFKIKNVASVAEIKKRVDEIIVEWAQKYKMNLKEINDTTYYILGKI
ncbi:type II secretion system protein [Campylobacter sp. faydin G-24]|uniref:Type II secretion system protein n=1 Tax=Campylobacter anatolicus TaxID=2829105 RepID=A0ABS5HJ57_9BACT|nr:type II secretion system protein [Campylobacter anatolicus]MBR8462670.1 type II secretion system protein [Campylobacter anatolicus]MBR8464162.1 type II secretion system protein [Campylobacter anatolicus]MBR8466067.1 type II secretion system protein [Campylobacter anatolicus]